MKTLGLIGGLSWYSTVVYYRTINTLVGERLGESHSARLILHSVDFDEFRRLQSAGDWGKIDDMLTGISRALEVGGAECVVMCTNTPHLVADSVRKKIGIPLIHIAEETAKEITGRKMGKVGLLGTKFTMENPFFSDKLAEKGIVTAVPEAPEREFIHAAIFGELTKGIFDKKTKARFIAVIEELERQGAEAIVFGCTEIGLLLSQADCGIPALDTALIHARAAVDFALSDSQ